MIYSLICRFLGHAWRRPHKDESVPVDSRICRRCKASRAVAKRKPKVEA